MEKEFVTYELALRMKQLGFDEPCFGYYLEDGEWQPASYSYDGTVYPSNKDLLPLWVSAPLFQQAFRWFREKYKLHNGIVPYYDYYYYLIKDFINGEEYRSNDLVEFTYEEAELACLEKLIEIVEQKQKEL